MRAANRFVTVTLLGTVLLSCAKKDNKEDELSSMASVVASSQQLPACSAENTAQVYWVEEQEKLYVCNGSTFVEIKGSQGDKGDTGSSGQAGPAGSAANSGVWVFDKNGKAIGVLMDSTLGTILFTNGGFARINLTTGEYRPPVLMIDGAMSDDELNFPFSCAWTETSCGGTCYIPHAAPKGSVIRTSATTYVVANGDEQEVLNVTTKSTTSSNGSCNNPGFDVAMNGYPVVKPYNLLEGITFPLQTPLSFGFKTEE